MWLQDGCGLVTGTKGSSKSKKVTLHLLQVFNHFFSITSHRESEEPEEKHINPAYSFTSATEVSSSPAIYDVIPAKTHYTNLQGVECGEEEEEEYF